MSRANIPTSQRIAAQRTNPPPPPTVFNLATAKRAQRISPHHRAHDARTRYPERYLKPPYRACITTSDMQRRRPGKARTKVGACKGSRIAQSALRLCSYAAPSRSHVWKLAIPCRCSLRPLRKPTRLPLRALRASRTRVSAELGWRIRRDGCCSFAKDF